MSELAEKILSTIDNSVNFKNAVGGGVILMSKIVTSVSDISYIAKDITEVATAIGAVILVCYNAVKLFKEFKTKKNESDSKS